MTFLSAFRHPDTSPAAKGKLKANVPIICECIFELPKLNRPLWHTAHIIVLFRQRRIGVLGTLFVE